MIVFRGAVAAEREHGQNESMARAMRAPGSLKPKAIRPGLRPGRLRQGQAPGLPALPAPWAGQAPWSRAAGAAAARSAMRSALDHAGGGPVASAARPGPARPGPARPGPARPGPARPQASGHPRHHQNDHQNQQGTPQSGVCGCVPPSIRGLWVTGRGRAGPGAEGDPGDEPDLGVGGFDQGVGQAAIEGGVDLGAVPLEVAARGDERLEAGPLCPGEPFARRFLAFVAHDLEPRKQQGSRFDGVSPPRRIMLRRGIYRRRVTNW